MSDLRATLDAHFSHAGDCDNTRFGRCTCDYYGARAKLRAALAAPQASEPIDVDPCPFVGRYQGFSDANHNERWYGGQCTLPKGHLLDLAYHEHFGLRLSESPTQGEQ